MKVSSFVTGMAAGAAAIAVASAMAAGAMQSPKMRHGMKKAADSTEAAVHHIGAMM